MALHREMNRLMALEGWNDDLLHSMREKIKFPSIMLNRAELKKILSRFYEFYFFGKIRQSDNFQATVFDAIAIAKTMTGPLWEETDFSTTTDFYNSNYSQEEFVQVANFPAARSEEFIIRVEKMIRSIDVSKIATPEEERLVTLTGYLALVLCRAAVKNDAQLSREFSKSSFRKNLDKHCDWDTTEPFLLPCEACINHCTFRFNGSYHIGKLFTLLVSNYAKALTGEMPNSIVAEFLNSAVLQSTAGNGIQIISLLEEAKEILNMDWETFCDYASFNLSEKSWTKFNKFKKEYMDPSNPQYGYLWARIIDKFYLQEYAAKENRFLAHVCGSVIECHRGPGIFNSAWAKKYYIHSDFSKKFGKALYDRRVLK